MIRALGKLPFLFALFLPCGVGTHMSRLRHLGWAQCSRGLTSHGSLSSGCSDGALGSNTHAPSLHKAFFPRIFSPRVYLGWVDLLELVRGLLFPLVISWIAAANWEDTSRHFYSKSSGFRSCWASNAEKMEKISSP